MSSKLWDFVLDLTADYIDKKANQTNLRAEYADIMLANRLRNRNISDLVDQFLDADREIERKFSRGRDDRPEDYYRDAIPTLVDGHFALSVLANRQIADKLDDRTYNGMRDSAEEFEELMRGGGGRRRDRGRDRDGGASSRYDTDHGQDRQSFRESYSPPGAGRRDNRQATTNSAWDVMTSAGEEINNDRRDDDRNNEVEREEPVRPVYTEPPREAEPSDPIYGLSKVEGPDYSLKRPHDVFMRNGERWEVAHLSKLKLTSDLYSVDDFIDAVPAFYNINEYVKYLVLGEDGIVREELIKVDNDNRYEAHEVRDRRDEVERIAAPAAAGLSLSALKKGELPQDLDSAEAVQIKRNTNLLDAIKGVEIPEASAINSELDIKGAVFNSRAKLAQSGGLKRSDIHLIRTPLVVSSWTQLDHINEIFNSNSLTDAAARLTELKSVMDISLWEILNDRFGLYLKRALWYSFQISGINKFSFAKDWGRVLEWLDKNYDRSTSAEFAKRCSPIIGRACQIIARNDLPEQMSDIVDPEEAKLDEVPTVVFIDFNVIISVAPTLDQLGIGAQMRDNKTGVSVTTQQHRELLNELTMVFRAADQALPSSIRYSVLISTADNRLIEVFPFAMRREQFVLAQVN